MPAASVRGNGGGDDDGGGSADGGDDDIGDVGDGGDGDGGGDDGDDHKEQNEVESKIERRREMARRRIRRWSCSDVSAWLRRSWEGVSDDLVNALFDGGVGGRELLMLGEDCGVTVSLHGSVVSLCRVRFQVTSELDADIDDGAGDGGVDDDDDDDTDHPGEPFSPDAGCSVDTNVQQLLWQAGLSSCAHLLESEGVLSLQDCLDLVEWRVALEGVFPSLGQRLAFCAAVRCKCAE
jgi:hypothetical protein